MRATTRLATSLFCLFLLAAPAFAETELSPQQLERLEALYDKILADEITSLSMDELREYFQLEFALSDGDEELAVARLRVHLYQWSQHHDQKMEDVVAQLKERPKPQILTVSYQPTPNFGNFNIEQFLNILPETFEGLDAVVMPDLVTLPNVNFNFTNITQQLNGINQLTTFSAVQAGLNPPMQLAPPIIPPFIGQTYVLGAFDSTLNFNISGAPVVRLPDGRIADVILNVPRRALVASAANVHIVITQGGPYTGVLSNVPVVITGVDLTPVNTSGVPSGTILGTAPSGDLRARSGAGFGGAIKAIAATPRP